MINLEQMDLILEALPDPAFILSRSGKYVAVFGGVIRAITTMVPALSACIFQT